MSQAVPVGIADCSVYAPERFLPAAEIAEASGIPETVIVDKFGLLGKHIARDDEHTSDMCISAARPIVERNDPAEIDAVMYFGSHWKDYPVWNAAPKIQDALGLEGFAFEAINVSAGAPVALKIATDMLRADPHLRSILMVAASKESHLIDFANQRSRFMFNFGDGGVAVLLRRGEARNQVLQSSLMTDGSFWHQVRVPAGGSARPASIDTVTERLHFLDVTDPQDMKHRLDPITLKNFLRVAHEACERSRIAVSDLAWCLPIHMKRSIHDSILAELGLTPEQSLLLDRYGHMSAVDPLFSLTLLRDQGRLRDGDHVLLLAAGTGYTWGASVVRWGEPR